MPGVVFERTYYGSCCFALLSKKKKVNFFKKLNEFYSVTEMTLNKGTFLQNSDFVVVYSNFVQNQITVQCNDRLSWHVSNDRSSVSIVFFVNPYDTSKIRDVDDANRLAKICETQIVKKF